jgi:hypothetical protein
MTIVAIMTIPAIIALAMAGLAAAIGCINLVLVRTPRKNPIRPGTLVSILIPARNEEANISDAITAALASTNVDVEIIVMDDGSTDRTPAIVQEFASRDPRVRLESAPPLPEGWTGKVHACQKLADAARGTHLLFVDADVRLVPQAAARLTAHLQGPHFAGSRFSMVSGVPRQITKSLGEMLTVPMINLMMLGYLPIIGMRARPDPGFGAACGQLIMVDKAVYDALGGHGAIRNSLHDGLKLARRFRENGLMTDIVAGHALATCRMYDGFDESWNGFLKNAHEGMATPVQLPVWTLLLGGGHILPWLLAPFALLGFAPFWTVFAALLLSMGLRSAITLRTGESLWTIPLHPVTVGVGLAIQWSALLRARRGLAAGWKGRV